MTQFHTVSRRRVLQTAALAAGCPPLTSELSEERLRALAPAVLERRAAQLRAVREFEVDDRVPPTTCHHGQRH